MDIDTQFRSMPSKIIHHHPTSFHMVTKRVQHVEFNKAEHCWKEMLYPFVRGVTKFSNPIGY